MRVDQIIDYCSQYHRLSISMIAAIVIQRLQQFEALGVRFEVYCDGFETD
jgi:hypothetical protein